MFNSNLGCVQGDRVITFKCIALIYTELPRSCKLRLLKKENHIVVNKDNTVYKILTGNKK